MTLFSALRALPDMEVVGLNFSSATTPELLLKTFDHYCEYRKTPNGVILSPVQVGLILNITFLIFKITVFKFYVQYSDILYVLTFFFSFSSLVNGWYCFATRLIYPTWTITAPKESSCSYAKLSNRRASIVPQIKLGYTWSEFNSLAPVIHRQIQVSVYGMKKIRFAIFVIQFGKSPFIIVL